MAKVLLYITASCPYCTRALGLLRRKGADLDEVRIDLDPARREEMVARSQRQTVPQIFIGDAHIGGYDELVELDVVGELDERLQR